MTPRNADFDICGADVPLRFPGRRVRFSLGVVPGTEARRRRALLNEHLRERHEWALLQAIADGDLPVAQVVRMLKASGLQALPELRKLAESSRLGAVPTLRQEADRYMAHYEASREAWSTKNTRSRLKRVGEQLVESGGLHVPLDSLPIDAVSRTQVLEAVRAVSTNGSTLNNLIGAVSGLFNWSIHEEAEQARTTKRAPRWSVNPCATIKPPKRTKRIVTASDEQVAALLAAGQLYQIAYVRAYTQIGLRLSELTHTRLHLDFDPKSWIWRIQGRGPDPRCRCPQCRTTGWTPKSESGTRTFRIPESQRELRAAIAAWIEVSEPGAGDFLFRRPGGQPWSNRTLGADFATLCGTAGVPHGTRRPHGITLHALRHTCATNLVRAGVRESVAAALLGDTVKTFVENYVHLNEEDLADAIDHLPAYATEGS